jgi:hypothetical protein
MTLAMSRADPEAESPDHPETQCWRLCLCKRYSETLYDILYHWSSLEADEWLQRRSALVWWASLQAAAIRAGPSWALRLQNELLMAPRLGFRSWMLSGWFICVLIGLLRGVVVGVYFFGLLPASAGLHLRVSRRLRFWESYVR